MADVAVPPDVVAEVTQILSNLVLGDNQIRSSAEQAVEERLASTPELYLLAIAQFATSADTELMRSFSLVLLRRLLFRPSTTHRVPLYDHLGPQAIETLHRILLHSLLHEPAPVVRRKTVDTVTDLSNNASKRGYPWNALRSQVFAMADSPDVLTREAAFRVFAGCPNLLVDLPTDATVALLQRGLQDAQSTEVRLAALCASAAFLTSSDLAQQAQALALMYPMLNTLPSVPRAQQPPFLSVLTDLAASNPHLFRPHIPALLTFLPSLLLPVVDAGPTPTVARPNPGTFAFPPVTSAGKGENGEERENGEDDEVRKGALEFMTTLSEAKPSMLKGVEAWVNIVVRGCLEGMGEIPEDDTEAWLDADPAEDPTEDSYPHTYEHSLDRVACALGGAAVLPQAFSFIPAMLASHDWRLRHAGLMAIASIAEGTSKVMQNELGKVIDLVVPMFGDAHPRVRYAACQCIGQLCTDLEEVVQEKFHQQIFAALIPALEAPEARVHAHAAAALINFCEGVERETLIPYLDSIVERLLKLLNPAATDAARQPKRYVQEQVITTLAMVADASEATFAKHYATIMPLLLNVMQNANGAEYRKLRVKAMECAGLIAIAVGRDIFRPDSRTFVELLMRIQNSPVDPNDTMLSHFLIATWAKVCQALGEEFEPYLPVVMPPLLRVASSKADISIYGTDDDEEREERDGWESISMDGRQVGVKTSALEDKCQAFETLLIHASTLNARFGPYVSQTLELALPGLRFYIHDGVQEACAMLIPVLFSCGKNSGTLTQQMVAATFSQLINCIGHETDSSFLASLFKCVLDTMLVIGGPAALAPEFHSGLLEATKRQLQSLADRRKARAGRPSHELREDKEDLMLIEEMEDFALEDMAKVLRTLDADHPLLIAVSSVRELGLHLSEWESEDEGGVAG
ncbi:ARM repeat-containing protein [Dichomitus squalens]|uniref:ARM repeat-containing protein n=1 Tax=Dichomitus squalens TaxID=114155 RepID=A0A4V2K675_9APHY|nr:ARM repeat-containing protein [Dichomitus squalens]